MPKNGQTSLPSLTPIRTKYLLLEPTPALQPNYSKPSSTHRLRQRQQYRVNLSLQSQQNLCRPKTRRTVLMAPREDGREKAMTKKRQWMKMTMCQWRLHQMRNDLQFPSNFCHEDCPRVPCLNSNRPALVGPTFLRKNVRKVLMIHYSFLNTRWCR